MSETSPIEMQVLAGVGRHGDASHGNWFEVRSGFDTFRTNSSGRRLSATGDKPDNRWRLLKVSA